MSKKPFKIGILRLHAIGDCVLASPVVAALRERYPEADITWIVKSKSVGVVEGLPGLTSTLVWDVDRSRKRSRFLTLLKVRMAKFDVLLDLHTRPQSQFVAPFLKASRAPRRIGGTNSAELSRQYLTEILPEGEPQHLRTDCLERARLLDIAPDSVQRHYPQLPLFNQHRESIQKYMEQNSLASTPRLVVMNLGGGTGPERKWPVTNFARLTKMIWDTVPGAKIVILGGPGDAFLFPEYQKALETEKVGKNANQNIVNAVGALSLMELAALAERCDLFVTTDTGPMHIAAAVGAPIVALFGPTNILTNAPTYKPGSAPIRVLDAREVVGEWPVSLETLTTDYVFEAVSTYL